MQSIINVMKGLGEDAQKCEIGTRKNTTPVVFAQKREWSIYLVPELLVVAAK